MAKRVLLCLSHSIEEHDQLRLLHGLGYEVASIGGYIDPAAPHDSKRPPLYGVPCVPEVKEAVDQLATPDNLGAAQSRIPEGVLDWLGTDGVVVFHHYLGRLYGQWTHLKGWRSRGGRVVWRTVGQSVEANEREARPFREEGLEIVRYSPRERNIPGYAGEDALIRFYKDADDFDDWNGNGEHVLNISQGLKRRDPWTNYSFWQRATDGLPTAAFGPESEEFGGGGEISYGSMVAELAHARCYLYCGTQPASYTLGLLEAAMAGCPVVSIGPSWMTAFPYGPLLFEGHLLVEELNLGYLWSDDPVEAREMLRDLLDDHGFAAEVSEAARMAAIEHFGRETVGRAWRDFLGEP